jgi:hypothetical protein
MKRTRLSPISDRRRAEAKEYAEKREAFLRQRPVCERCDRRSSRDVHHKAGRYGGNYLNVATWAALCRHCHDDIHQHPSQARASGWLT